MLAAAIWLTAAQAQEQPSSASPATSKRSNPLPASVTEAVSAKLPKYVPPTLQPVQPVAPPGTTGGGDQLDEIFYLPNLKVTTGKPPPVTEFDFLTKKGRLDLALKTNPGLRFGPLAKLNNPVAVEMQKEELEAGKRDALAERVLSIAVGDEAQAKELIRLMKAATARPNTDWLTKSAGSK